MQARQGHEAQSLSLITRSGGSDFERVITVLHVRLVSCVSSCDSSWIRLSAVHKSTLCRSLAWKAPGPRLPTAAKSGTSSSGSASSVASKLKVCVYK